MARIISRKRRLLDDEFGLEDIEESPEQTVMDLIKSWTEYSNVPLPKDNTSLLGIGNALPPLPRFTDILQVIFAGERWSKSGIRAWMKMNGYKDKSLKFDGQFWRATCNDHKAFANGSFSTFSVSREIKIIIGKRREGKRGPIAGNKKGRRVIQSTHRPQG